MGMTTTKTTKEASFVGRCKRCKDAGRDSRVRLEGVLEVTRSEHERVRYDGAALEPRISVRRAVRLPDTYVGDFGDSPIRFSRPCPTCSKSVLVSYLVARESSHKCGAKCRASTGPVCECSCGGKNHGCG
jgi:hypothetical protein